MPGQRDTRKKVVGAYVDQDLKQDLVRLAERHTGGNLSMLLERILREAVQRYDKQESTGEGLRGSDNRRAPEGATAGDRPE
jgi:hypothetical protein